MKSYANLPQRRCIWALTIAVLAPLHAAAEPPAPAPIQTKQTSPVSAADAFEDYRRTIPGSEVDFEMVAVPGGVFRMGSPDDEPDRRDDEGPQFDVKIDPFWMGRNEVTWAEYQRFMALNSVFEKFNDRGVRPVEDKLGVDVITAPSKLYEPSFTYTPGEGPRQPAVTMSQYAAKQYTKWLSLLTGEFYRLPTEAEWEYACRAGTTTAYHFGDDAAALDDYAWYYENAEDQTHDVGTKKPNAWGLHDMHGNASEWVLDELRDGWYASLSGEPVAQSEALCWPEVLYPRVLRGGSWNLDPPDCRSATRRPSDDDVWRSYDPNSPQSPWWFASDESQDVGFRIVRPQHPPPRGEWAKYWDADLPEIQKVVDHRIDDEGRGERGRVDPELPAAIEQLDAATK
jgi:formylglycine-generating enzyme required for sulfatase activity